MNEVARAAGGTKKSGVLWCQGVSGVSVQGDSRSTRATPARWFLGAPVVAPESSSASSGQPGLAGTSERTGKLGPVINRHRGAVVALGLLALAALIAVVSAFATAEVVAKGRLVPTDGPGARRIRIWDAVEFYISSETARPSNDVMTYIVLTAIAAVLAFAALVLVIGGRRERLVGCFAVGAVGAGYLAVDELVAIHESLGHNMLFLRSWTGVERPDDLIFVSYTLPACAYFWFFRGELLSLRASRVLLGAGVACMLLGVVSDLGDIGAEENLELLAAAALGTGFVWLAAARVGSCIRR